MRPAEEHHLINASRKVKRKSETAVLDVRETEWTKTNGIWTNNLGWSPSDKESVLKLERWVAEITRLTPSENVGKDPSEDDDDLTHQLSAVESHRKIEIDQLKASWRDAEVEEEKHSGQTPLGQELEKEPWVMRVKMELALIFSVAITSLLLYGNHLRIQANRPIFEKTAQSQSEGGKFSSAFNLPGIGNVYLYNQTWPKYEGWREDIKSQAMRILTLYNQAKLVEPKRNTKEEEEIIKAINRKRKPLLVIIPEATTHTKDKTKLWASREGIVLIERTREGKKSWKLTELPDRTVDSIPFLNIKLHGTEDDTEIKNSKK